MTEQTRESIDSHKVKDRNTLIKQLRKHGGIIFGLLRKNNMLKELPIESLEFWLNQAEKERR